MSAYLCWCAQRDALRESLKTADAASAAASLTRHTLAQVEQNAMAEQTDDLLRQQTGILFSCVKMSLNLLDISVTTKVWVAQSLSQKPKRNPVGALALALACVLLALVCWLAYTRGEVLVWAPLLLALVALGFGWAVLSQKRKTETIPDDRLRVTAIPDADKLFPAIDAQMKAIDRFINDFVFLNEQSALMRRTPDQEQIALLADLLEAAQSLNSEESADVASAAELLLQSYGVRAEFYQPSQAGLFSILPSVSETRTLVPALLSLEDGSLLRRGTAAVLLPATTR